MVTIFFIILSTILTITCIFLRPVSYTHLALVVLHRVNGAETEEYNNKEINKEVNIEI